MICLNCPQCKSKLNAKDKLAGQTRKCPNCGTQVKIPHPNAAAQPAVEQADAGQPGLLALDVPQRLDRMNRYLICDNTRLVASWENNGRGWMLKTGMGMISARHNPDQLPNRGDFKLIELKFVNTDDGPKLNGITSYQLAAQWALVTLDKGDDKILSKISGPGHLDKNQKKVVRQTIMDHLMHQVWTDADNVLEYLASTDYHSPGT